MVCESAQIPRFGEDAQRGNGANTRHASQSLIVAAVLEEPLTLCLELRASVAQLQISFQLQAEGGDRRRAL